MLSVYASAAAVAFVAVVIAVHRLFRRRGQPVPPTGRVSAAFITRDARNGEVVIAFATDHGRVEVALSPYLAAVIARELTGANPKRTH